jgi:hypothetical protein
MAEAPEVTWPTQKCFSLCFSFERREIRCDHSSTPHFASLGSLCKAGGLRTQNLPSPVSFLKALE